MVWLAYEPDKDIKDRLGSVPLVAESEWGTDDEIDHDFEKLLLARADLRVMIFGGKNDDNDGTAERLFGYVSKFNRGGPDDAYLLAGHERDEIGFRFYRIKNGQERQVRDDNNWRTVATSWSRGCLRESGAIRRMFLPTQLSAWAFMFGGGPRRRLVAFAVEL